MNRYLYYAAAGALALSAQAQTSYVEDFSDVNAIDLARTIGRVDTDAGEARLAPASGVFQPGLSLSVPPKVTFQISQGFDEFAIGDISGDGFDDVFFLDRGNDYVALSGAGGELTGSVAVVSDNFDDQRAMKLVDFDGDNDLDIFIGNEETCCTSDRSYFLVNDGSQGFPAGVTTRYSVGTLEEGVTASAFADLNGDDRVDMILRSQDNATTYYLNDGTATPFPESARRSLPGNTLGTTAIIPADFNNDGLIDLFLATTSFSTRSILVLNTGNPTEPFSSASPDYTLNVETNLIAAADMNGDGLIDVVGNDRFSDSLVILFNDGGPNVFSNTLTVLNFGAFSFAGVLDIDRNGMPDVLARNYNPARIYINQGAGSFSTSSFIELIPSVGSSALVRDINRDGIEDIGYASNNFSQLELYLGEDGRSPFGSGSTARSFGDAGAFTTSIAVADLDNDGDVDIVEGANGSNRVYINNNGNYNDAFTITDDQDVTRSIVVADFNGDGFADVVAANDGVNRWYPNDLGDGPFLRGSGGIPIGSEALNSLDVIVVDVNLDGLPDLVFANDGVNTLVLNDGGDTPFSGASVAIAVGQDAQLTNAVRSADVTGDGFTDLIFANDGGDIWVANEGVDAGFGPTSIEQPLGSDTTASAGLAIADLNFDNVPDVVLAKPMGPCLWIAGAGNTDGFAAGGEGVDFAANCSGANSVAARAAGPGEVEILAGSDTPFYYRVLQSLGVNATIGFAVTTEVAPLRDLLFMGDGNVLAANFFAANAIYERASDGFDGTPGPGLFSLVGNRIQSRPLIASGEDVTTASLEVQSSAPANTRIEWFASNDGLNFVPVTPGSVVEFETEGSFLVWAADLYSLSSAVTPTIAEVIAEINPVDDDNDSVADAIDNCTQVSNPGQLDSDGDGYGNACDADLNNDGIVNVQDLGIMRAVFFSTVPSAADLNSDGVVNATDLGLLRQMFFMPPGPSALVD